MTSPHKSLSSSEDHSQNCPRDRIDADPPYESNFPEKVTHFRDLLAEMIARQIAAERRGPKYLDNKNDT